MKLRNKKTGEIVDLSIFGITLNIRKEEQPTYHSIEGVCEDWEDYKPAEPLIKDKKIRKAVRAWVEIGKYEHIYYDRAYNRLADDYDFVHCIEFAIDPCPDAESGRCYTLTELCGEED